MKKYIIVALCTVIVLAGVYINFTIKNSLPNYEGEVRLSGLTGKVTVLRDQWGVPHIEAENERDLYLALGYTMAGDRLFQMDLLRRIGNGQLSEVLGTKTKDIDVLLRTLKLRKHADYMWKKYRPTYDPKMISVMEAFFEGVHQYMETRPLPIEFILLGYKPRPFVIEESLAVSGYIALSFAEGIIADPLYTDLLSDLGETVVQEMWLRDSNDKNSITDLYKKKNSTSFKSSNNSWYTKALNSLDFLEENLGLFHGSNSWVVSGKKSATGKPLLANDPHVAFSNPGVWYEAHLKSPEYENYGFYTPLIPFPAMGHNSKRAWAVTMSEMDDLDIYQEKIRFSEEIAQRKGEVLFNNEWVPLQIDQEIIKVKGEEDFSLKVMTTPHGPIIDSTKYGKNGNNYSVKWSFLHPENNIALGFYKLAYSEKVEDLDEALKHASAPGLNISWADSEGNIAWRVMGKVPLRRGFKGNQVLEGWSGKHEYERYFTIKENPGLLNPANGQIVTANYKPYYLGDLPIDGYWQPSERYERINFLLGTDNEWTLEKFKAIQTDQFVSTGLAMKEELINNALAEDEVEKQILNKFKNWQGESHKESFGSAVYHMWIFQLGREALMDEMGEERFLAFTKVADYWHFLKTFLFNSESDLWDNKETSVKESRADIIKIAFTKMKEKLLTRLGSDVESWQWGNLHTVEYGHPLGKVKPLDKIFNLGPFPAGGGSFQINNMSSPRSDEEFKVTLGASVRRLIDFSRPEEGLAVFPTGNVGHFLSDFYDDQVQLFLEGKYRPMRLDLDRVRESKHKVLSLIPEHR